MFKVQPFNAAGFFFCFSKKSLIIRSCSWFPAWILITISQELNRKRKTNGFYDGRSCCVRLCFKAEKKIPERADFSPHKSIRIEKFTMKCRSSTQEYVLKYVFSLLIDATSFKKTANIIQVFFVSICYNNHLIIQFHISTIWWI